MHVIHHPFSYPIHIGSRTFELSWFGAAVLLGFAVAQHISQRELARRGHDPEPVGDLIFAAVVGGLVGAKIYFVFLTGHLDEFFSRSGFVFWGGLIGGIVAVTAVVVKKKLSIPRIADVAGIAIAAAYAVGRTGCWAVGDDYGRPWNSRFAVAFPEGIPPSTAANMHDLFGIPVPPGVAPNTVLSVYPTQIFETALGVVMFFILWRLRDHKHAEGWLFGLYCVLAGVERFLIEFLRAKDDRFFGFMTMAQLFALSFVVAGVIIMQRRATVGGNRLGIHASV